MFHTKPEQKFLATLNATQFFAIVAVEYLKPMQLTTITLFT